MAPNFTDCGSAFEALYSAGNKSLAYNGTISGVLSQGDRPALITIAGCLELCGHGFELYSSEVWTNTVTTWVLPVVGGLLLQAPFESNRFWRTFFAIMRWLGSPISSLTYVLWNIKVLGKCALMVDMAVGYSEEPSETTPPAAATSASIRQRSDFARMRDSFYLLSVMNQFNIPPILPGMSAERLLRIALFSDTLVLTTDGPNTSLPTLRGNLARDMRSRRRRGTVPVFISVFWFLVSLAISINTAFGQLGDNATAHNLALGLMLGWLPVFVLACIVDRNPVSTNEVRKTLNHFLNVVRLSLLDPNNQKSYVQNQSELSGQMEWLGDLVTSEEVFESFFRDFAGQGRTRWHYGVAHSVLGAIEDVGVAEHGRGWFQSLPERHDKLVLGPTNPTGLHYFDWHEFWQIVAAIAIVFGTLLGAFVISIYTPTVGLGCRSGGYMIYFILAISSFTLEMAVWFNLSAKYKGRAAIPSMRLLRRMSTARAVESQLKRFKKLPLHEKLDRVVFKPWDMINTGWLVYIVCSQTFGLYRTCQCTGSTWGLGFNGGYVDFLSVLTYKAKGIIVYWAVGTGISIAVLLFASVYIFAEWLTQSHLSTENYERAMRGLRRTRTWKKYTRLLRFCLQILPRLAIKVGRLCKSIWHVFQGRRRVYNAHHGRSLQWSTKPRHRTIIDQEDLPLIAVRNTSTSSQPSRSSGVDNKNIRVDGPWTELSQQD